MEKTAQTLNTAADSPARARRILITGSADGLGLLAARALIQAGHRVTLHARNAQRAEDALRGAPGAEGVLIADLARLEEVKSMAEEANRRGRFDAVIHNAAVYSAPGAEILTVNVLSPYILTCLIQRPPRLVYISSSSHLHGRPDLQRLRRGQVSYADSKFYILLLSKAVARRWPEVYANAVDPGWVPTKMGGPHAPDSLVEGYRTQVWLAADEGATLSGRYFYHMKEVPYHRGADDPGLQEEFLAACAELTGVRFPSEER